MNPSVEKPIRPAASLLIVRDGEEGVEVLTLKRAVTMRFLPGYLAFPGGAVESADVDAEPRWRFPPQASEQVDDKVYATAAIRECAEEVGWLCGISNRDGQGMHFPLSKNEQEGLLSAEGTFMSFLEARDWWLDGKQLRFVGRWVTPNYQPARFDTRFFVVSSAPMLEELHVHTTENQWVRWCRPTDMLAAIAAGREEAVMPTRAMMSAISKMTSASECAKRLHVPGPA